MNNKIYTKTGDKGFTTLVGGTPSTKDSLRIEAYGEVDELLCWIGFLKECLETNQSFFLMIQSTLMQITALLATPENTPLPVDTIKDSKIIELEKEIDSIEKVLPPITRFILPGGNILSSQFHIARTVCRRAERRVVNLSTKEYVEDNILKYLNRLSDLLFVYARKINHDNKIKDIFW